MSGHEEIGARVRESLGGMTQTALAERVGMTTDAMSRALRGQRGFSSIELAEIADVLRTDVHWLITGQEDPLRIRLAARHDWNPETGARSNPGRAADEELLDGVKIAFAQVADEIQTSPADLPGTPEAVREALGEDFVRDFATRVEDRLGVFVVRLQRLTTAYALTIGSRRVIVLPADGNWFRSNYSLAHELGHLALGHHDVGDGDEKDEAPANAFAAELLLPASLIRTKDWVAMRPEDLAKFLWDSGVSTVFLRNRLNALRVDVSPEIEALLLRKMPGLLRAYEGTLGSLVRESGPFSVPVSPIDQRMSESARRRFPDVLTTAHRKAVEEGKVTPATLAWILESPVEGLIEDDEVHGDVEDLLAAFAN